MPIRAKAVFSFEKPNGQTVNTEVDVVYDADLTMTGVFSNLHKAVKAKFKEMREGATIHVDKNTVINLSMIPAMTFEGAFIDTPSSTQYGQQFYFIVDGQYYHGPLKIADIPDDKQIHFVNSQAIGVSVIVPNGVNVEDMHFVAELNEEGLPHFVAFDMPHHAHEYSTILAGTQDRKMLTYEEVRATLENKKTFPIERKF